MLMFCGYLGLLCQNYLEEVNVVVVENVFYGLVNGGSNTKMSRVPTWR